MHIPYQRAVVALPMLHNPPVSVTKLHFYFLSRSIVTAPDGWYFRKHLCMYANQKLLILLLLSLCKWNIIAAQNILYIPFIYLYLSMPSLTPTVSIQFRLLNYLEIALYWNS